MLKIINDKQIVERPCVKPYSLDINIEEKNSDYSCDSLIEQIDLQDISKSNINHVKLLIVNIKLTRKNKSDISKLLKNTNIKKLRRIGI